MLPLFSSESTENLISDGVTVPRRNSGKTKITRQANRAAQISKLVLIVMISNPEIPRITYFPRTGIAAIQIAAIRIRR